MLLKQPMLQLPANIEDNSNQQNQKKNISLVFIEQNTFKKSIIAKNLLNNRKASSANSPYNENVFIQRRNKPWQIIKILQK